MEMVNVRSNCMRAVGYDPETRRMKITFAEGKTYDFCGVPEKIFKDLLAASSKGTYYNIHIRDKFQC